MMMAIVTIQETFEVLRRKIVNNLRRHKPPSSCITFGEKPLRHVLPQTTPQQPNVASIHVAIDRKVTSLSHGTLASLLNTDFSVRAGNDNCLQTTQRYIQRQEGR